MWKWMRVVLVGVGWTICGAAGGTAFAIAGIFVLNEIVRPIIWPLPRGSGFDEIGFFFYLFGVPWGTFVGAVVGCWWHVRRLRMAATVPDESDAKMPISFTSLPRFPG